MFKFTTHLNFTKRKEKKKEQHKIYRETHKEEKREIDKIYRENHKEETNEHDRIRNQNPERKLKREKHNSEKIICMCGQELRRDSISKHIRTQKHQNYIKNQQE